MTIEWARILTAAAALSFAAMSSAQTSSTRPGTSSQTASSPETAPIPEKDIYCPIGLEPILPTDYYACEARAAAGRKHYRKMISMLEEAAYWANKDAQYVLGLAYFNGDMAEAPLNKPLGLAWLALAAERKNPQYQLAYAVARAHSTPEEIRQGLVEWRKLQVKYGDAVAAPRAIRHFNHAIAPIDDAARYGGIVYLQGFSPYPQSAFAVANKLHDEAEADFDNVHGTVVVGKPDWVQAKPTDVNAAQPGN